MKISSSLSWQILQKVVIVHGLVALLLTVGQLWVDYNTNLNSIRKNLTSSFAMFGPSISEAFYNANSKMIEGIFEGVLTQSDFLAVAVYDRLADEFIVRGSLNIKTEELKEHLQESKNSFRLTSDPNIIAYQHAMKIETELNEKRYFGNFIVFSSEKLAFERIQNTILIVLFNSLIKALVLLTMFMLIFNKLLIQPLSKINSVIANISSDNLQSQRLDLGISKSNELHMLQLRFNKLLDELYQAQENERILQHKSKFISIGEMIGNIAHQWRQPLASVNMIVAILLEKQKRGEIDEKFLEEKLYEIEKLNTYMSTTIENFLSFFNPDKRVEPFAIKEAIEDSIEIIKSKLEEENVEVVLNISLEHIIKISKQDLMEVLIILLSNSIDAFKDKDENNSERKIEVDVVVDKEVKIYVKDYGKGIDEDIIHRIFEPYFTQKHQSKGVGLGLYIAKMIVEKSLNGTISAKNHKNGAVFTITLKNH